MKTLIVFEKDTGNISFTQSINGAEDVEYASIIADVPEDRIVARIEEGEVILEDTPEVKEAKEKKQELEENLQKLKEFLLEKEMEEL